MSGLTREQLLEHIREMAVEAIKQEFAKSPAYLGPEGGIRHGYLKKALEKRDPDAPFEDHTWENMKLAFALFSFGAVMAYYYKDSEDPLSIFNFYSGLLLCAVLPLFIPNEIYERRVRKFLEEPETSSTIRSIIQEFLDLNRDINKLDRFLREKLPANATETEIRAAIRAYMPVFVKPNKFTAIFESKGAAASATPWYISGIAISLNSASDRAVDIVTQSIQHAIDSGAYDPERSAQAQEMLAAVARMSNNKDKILACLQFKLGHDQWNKLSAILQDSIYFDPLIFDPVCTETGHTYEQAAIRAYLDKRNADMYGLSSPHLDPGTGVELKDKTIKPNIAIAGLLAYLVFGDHDVQIANYPGFLDPKTGRRIKDPVIAPDGQTIEITPYVDLPKNVQLLQLMRAFPSERERARPRRKSVP